MAAFEDLLGEGPLILREPGAGQRLGFQTIRPAMLFGLVDQLVKRLGPEDIRALLAGDPAQYLGLPIPDGTMAAKG